MTLDTGGSLIALVTQWSGTAGPAICEVLAAQGFHVIVNGPMEELAVSGIQGKLAALPFDGLQEMAVLDARKAILEQFGRVDVLINNASMWNDAALPEISTRMWADLFDHNLKTTFLSCKAFGPVMLEAGFGKIINVTSSSGLTGAHTPYAAACAGVMSLTRSLAIELAPNVRVNCVACGLLDEPWIDQEGPEFRTLLQEKIPLRRLCKPEDVADLVAYLALSGDFFTGQVLQLDGGEAAL